MAFGHSVSEEQSGVSSEVPRAYSFQHMHENLQLLPLYVLEPCIGCNNRWHSVCTSLGSYSLLLCFLHASKHVVHPDSPWFPFALHRPSLWLDKHPWWNGCLQPSWIHGMASSLPQKWHVYWFLVKISYELLWLSDVVYDCTWKSCWILSGFSVLVAKCNVSTYMDTYWGNYAWMVSYPSGEAVNLLSNSTCWVAVVFYGVDWNDRYREAQWTPRSWNH